MSVPTALSLPRDHETDQLALSQGIYSAPPWRNAASTGFGTGFSAGSVVPGTASVPLTNRDQLTFQRWKRIH